MNAGGAIHAGEGVDLRVDTVRAFVLGLGLGLVGGIRGFCGVGGIGRISVVRGRTVLGRDRGSDAGVRICLGEVGSLHIAMHFLTDCSGGRSIGSEGRNENS